MISSSGQQLLSLLFNEGESVCVSHDGFGYHSVELSDLNYQTLELISPNESVGIKTVDTKEIKLIGLNPVEGWRRDENCTAYRTFLVEMDDGKLNEQLQYVRTMEMPYSCCIFSGGKSLHFGITLDRDLPNYETYYFYATWLLNIMNKADRNTKNPTRSIRMAGAMRGEQEQRLLEMKDRIGMDSFCAWLSRFETFKPKGFFKSGNKEGNSKAESPETLPFWVRNELRKGLDFSKGRNRRWFQIASEFGKAGYDEEDTINFLDNYFEPEYDFKRNEWILTIRSGVKNGHRKQDE